MRRRIVFSLAALAALALLSGCTGRIPRSGGDNSSDNGNSTEPQEIGASLYKDAGYPDRPAAVPVDIKLIGGHLTVFEKRDLPSEKDGTIHAIATEPDGGNIDTKDLIAHAVDKTKFFRPLRDAEHVRKNQLVMVLDDREAYMQVLIQESQVDFAKAEANSAEKTLALAEQYYLEQVRLNKAIASNKFEMEKSRLDRDRSQYDLDGKKANLKKAEQDLGKAKVLLEMHYIRSPIDGIMLPTNRKNGEAVRASETVIQVQNIARLRLEGYVDSGFRGKLHEGMAINVEPAIEINEQAIPAHLLPVTSVAVANGPAQEPYFVSGSLDKSIRVWQGRQQISILIHPSAVRSVACTPAGVNFNYCLSGADDGKLRLWDLSNRKLVREFESSGAGGFQHRGHITALAFSPNGQFAASADDQDICMWRVSDGHLLYRFPAVHRGAITTLAFTPQCRLISAGRDNSMRIWQLGSEGAREEYRLEGRSGDVGVLGTNRTGEQVLFDFQQSLRVVNVKDKKTDGMLLPGAESGRFATFALFSPDDAFILAGSNVEGRLSLYRAPSADNPRTSEIRQFRPENRMAMFTCAAFSPNPQAPFTVTGTSSGDLYVWNLPNKEDVKPLPAKITFIDHATDTSSRQIRVWAELDNPRDASGEETLMPGKTATMVIKMGQLRRSNKPPAAKNP